MQKVLHTGLVLGLALLIAPAASAQKKPAAKPQPPKKPAPTVGTVGTNQMAGTEGQIGVTYSLKENEITPKINFTITGVSYSTNRFLLPDFTLVPGKEKKYLVVRYVLHNPNTTDIELQGGMLTTYMFQAVGNDNKTYESENEAGQTFIEMKGLASGKPFPVANIILKPGQKTETLVSVIPIPTDVIVPKLVLKRGRFGTNEQVVRFDLRGKVTPDFGIFNDTANPAAPRAEIAGMVGTTYPLALASMTVLNIKRESGPLGNDVVAEEGNEFITGTVVMKNLTAQKRSFWADTKPMITLVNADGERKTFEDAFLTVSRSGAVEQAEVSPGDERRGVFFFQIPKGAKVKQVILQEWSALDLESRAVVFDASGL